MKNVRVLTGYSDALDILVCTRHRMRKIAERERNALKEKSHVDESYAEHKFMLNIFSKPRDLHDTRTKEHAA